MPAGSRPVRRRAGRRPKPIGATGTRTTAPPIGFSNGRRNPHRPSRSGYRLHCRDFPGIWRKTSSVLKALISLGLWEHY